MTDATGALVKSDKCYRGGLCGQSIFLTIFSGPKLIWDRGEILTIVSREKDDKLLLRDSRGNDQLVSSTYIRELPSSVKLIQFSILFEIQTS